jgi:uncharacterized glyoxalase superfamily protein PhnB
VSQRIVPFIGYEDADAAVAWLERAFGFMENRDQRVDDNGRITHAELELGGAKVFVASPDGYASPRNVRAESDLARRAYDNPWVIDGHFVEVEAVDAHFEGARAAGATILREPEDAPYGFRIYAAEDPEGHRWMFGEPR